MDTQEMRPSLLSGLKKNAWAWILVTIAAIVNWAAFSLEALPAGAATASRWAALFALGYLTWKRKSLTVWILFSLVLGAEVGFDFPQFADWYNVLSKMFIELIKTIIAPLLFGTLIVGIAGHADMKQVGRMGLKALIYFEIWAVRKPISRPSIALSRNSYSTARPMPRWGGSGRSAR